MTGKRLRIQMTADSPDGQPWPPSGDDDVLWAVVCRVYGFTIWRSISIQTGNDTTSTTSKQGVNDHE